MIIKNLMDYRFRLLVKFPSPRGIKGTAKNWACSDISMNSIRFSTKRIRDVIRLLSLVNGR